MVDKAKIIYMTKLAVYDRNDYQKDKNILKFFVNDYVYKQNVQTRIYIAIGYIWFVCFDYLSKIVLGELDIFLIDYMTELRKITINLVVLLALYTFVSSVTATVRYYEASKRQSKYFLMINQMEKLGKTRQPAKEDDGGYNGSSIDYTGNSR